jgi:hypothetical protein
MDGRAVAWLAYVPIPGLALIQVRLHPQDRLARYHAWQGTTLVVGSYLTLVLTGMLGLLSDAKAYRQTVGLLAGLVLVGALAQLLWGAFHAALGRYPRLQPAWAVVALLRR